MEESFSIEGDSEEASVAGRKAGRDSMFLQGALTAERLGDRVVTLRIRNLSEGGLMADFAERLDVGDRVKVDLRGIGGVAGSVAWRTGDRIGIAFDEPVDPQLARKPVNAAKPKSPTPPAFRRNFR